jgi:hypothetical protein
MAFPDIQEKVLLPSGIKGLLDDLPFREEAPK